MTTWANFLAQTRREIGEPVPGVWDDDSMLYWANEAAYDIARQAHTCMSEEYTASVKGVGTYTLPPFSLDVESVYYDSTPLLRRLRTDFTDLAQFDAEGTPRWYLVDDETLTLVPAPDTSDVEIRFFRYHLPDAITISSEMPFASLYNSAIGAYVKQRAMEQVFDWQAAGEFAARYAAELGTVMAQEARERGANMSVAPREVW